MKHIALVLCIVVVTIAGCIDREAVQSGIDTVDSQWRAENQALIETIGTRSYDVEKKIAMKAMAIALADLGLTVEEQDHEAGYMSARASLPAPLSIAEWKAVKDVEDPRIQGIVAAQAGDLAAGMVELADDDFDVLVNVVMTENASELQISFGFRTEYVGPDRLLAYGKEPPPEAVRLYLDKAWNAFEPALLAQKATTD